MKFTNHEQEAAIRGLIVKSFKLDEVETMCADLGISYEDLAGTTLTAKVRELCSYSSRHSRVKDLIDYCVQTRPNANWWSVWEQWEPKTPEPIVQTIPTPISESKTLEPVVLTVSTLKSASKSLTKAITIATVIALVFHGICAAVFLGILIDKIGEFASGKPFDLPFLLLSGVCAANNILGFVGGIRLSAKKKDGGKLCIFATSVTSLIFLFAPPGFFWIPATLGIVLAILLLISHLRKSVKRVGLL